MASTDDAELAAMSTIVGALDSLSDEVRSRVLLWAAGRYGVAPAASGTHRQGQQETPQDELRNSSRRFEDFADLFDRADPETEVDRALVAGYWFQVVQGENELDAQALNNALKDMGHGITNITRALTTAQAAKPALVRQIQKSGKTQQARKKYRLTTQGIRAAERMMAGEARHDETVS